MQFGVKSGYKKTGVKGREKKRVSRKSQKRVDKLAAEIDRGTLFNGS